MKNHPNRANATCRTNPAGQSPPSCQSSAERGLLEKQAESSYNLEFLGLHRAVKERAPDDRPSLGIILCAEKDDVEVEYVLRAKKNPIGVAVHQLQPNLPANLRGKLPTAKQLAAVVRSVLPERSGK